MNDILAVTCAIGHRILNQAQAAHLADPEMAQAIERTKRAAHGPIRVLFKRAAQKKRNVSRWPNIPPILAKVKEHFGN